MTRMAPKITTATRLTLGFGFVILLLLISFWIAASKLGELNLIVEQVSRRNRVKAELTREVVERMNENARATFELFLSADRQPILARIDSTRQKITEKLNALEAGIDTQGAAMLMAEVRRTLEIYVASFTDVATLLEEGRDEEAARLMRRETMDALNKAIAAHDALNAHYTVLLEQGAEAASRAYESGLRLLTTFAILAWLAASLSAVWIIRRVTRPLGGEPEEATAIALRIASGNLTGEIKLRPGDDESLMAAMKSMQQNMHNLLVLLNADAEEIESLNRDLEARVKQRTAELEAANRELESFGHAMAHDLQTPLRAQEGFSRVLLEEHAGKLDDETLDYVRRINNASLRMARLLDDLLDLMSITRADLKAAEVDLSQLALAAIAELRSADPQRRVETVVPPSVVVWADPVMMRIVMHNLLGNAWKFTRQRDDGYIELGSIEQDGRTIYFVRDNGVGFDLAYAGRLFSPFQRLVTLHQFEGSGIGLATVRRIVERHGGRIWAEAEPGKGASFYFTLHEVS